MLRSYLLGAMLLSITSAFSQLPDSLLAPSAFRNIGPFRGGRANGSSGVTGDKLTYYMGTTGGGVWKTTNGGVQWNNVSDGFFKTGSVGAVAVSESHPNTVYVGMGEHAPRGVMTSSGDGVYRSDDAGKTWRHLGLEATRHISRIVIHPDNPDIAWVAAQGALYGPNKERGIYQTTDGGKTWTQQLFVNERTGCSELSIDHHNPNVLYAAMWEHGRKPWEVVSGGPGSGLYKSSDGGVSWKKIHKGLPEEKGKMAIAVSRANPDVVYALIESDSKQEKGGLFVSTSAGNSWSRVSGDHRLIQRAWYYIEVFPDPVDEQTVYVLSASFYKSIDGGKSWEEISTNHGDYHDLWINPKDNSNMVVTDDGGAEVTYDGGKTWSPQSNMPTAQFYRIATDHLFPYHIYGGQQDNTSVKIASLALGSGGIDETDWEPSAGGESAFLAFDPENPVKVMGGSYLGTIELLDTKAKASTQIMIEPRLYLGLAARDMKYLFNWNAPIIRSVHNKDTWYHGAQYLLRTRDEGQSWEVASPDLTRNDDSKQGKGGVPYTNEAVGAENYGTLSYVIESPHEAGVLYTGSDDGLVHLTKDGGATWENVTPKGLPETLINAIEVSPHDPSTVYIATTRYKFNDHTPALYKSTNYGKTWTNISKGMPAGAFTRVVREDTGRKDLLFAGTELGLFISYDGGSSWSSFQRNLPMTPITDLAIAHDDLVVATSGRSFWIFDDMALLRQLHKKPDTSVLLKPEPAMMSNWYSGMNTASPSGTHPFEGVNPSSGMVIYYWLSDEVQDGDLSLDILNDRNEIVRTFYAKPDSTYVSYEGNPPKVPVLTTHKGLNRFVWDMRYPILPGTPKAYIEGSFRGRKAIPGTYRLKLTQGEKVSETESAIIPNPAIPVTSVQYDAYANFMREAEKHYVEMTQTTNLLFKVQQPLEKVLSQLQENTLRSKAVALMTDLKAWDDFMVQRLSKAYDDVENFENGFTAHFITMINHADSDIPLINEGTKNLMNELNATWMKKEEEAEALQARISSLNKELSEKGMGILSVY